MLSPRSRLWQACVNFTLQACGWLVLSIAIAAMLVLGGPFEWADAFSFSSRNWMPWALITPGVFWVSRRFPVVRGAMLRSIPVHLVACVVCSMAAWWMTAQFPTTFDLPRTLNVRPVPGGPPGPVRTVTFSPATTGTVSFAAGQPIAAVTSGTLFSTGTSVPGAVTLHAPTHAFGTTSLDVIGPTALPAAGVSRVLSSGPGPAMGGGVKVGSGVVVGASGFSTTFATPRPTWQMILMPLVMRANAGVAIYFIIASAAHAMAFYRQAQERQRQALALAASRNQAKLDALRLQLQPHFLFNTLNAISTLVHRDAHVADNLIGDLSDLLRMSLQTTAHEVTLARELELLDHYLAIQQTRLGERLRVVRDFDPATLGAYVPTLLLQPLAENAIRHGLEPRAAPGLLTVRTRRHGDTLCLSVIDDGLGFEPASLAQRRGIGLSNIEERLHTLYPGRADITLKARPGEGTRIEITLPFRTEPPGAAAPTRSSDPRQDPAATTA